MVFFVINSLPVFIKLHGPLLALVDAASLHDCEPNLICSVSVSLLQLKDDAVALVDVFAPSDFILNSPIGNADGQVKIFDQPAKYSKKFCS